MLVTLKDVLEPARAEHYAVPAFDCIEDVMVRAILETADQRRAPVILMGLLGGGLEGNGWAYIPPMIRSAAEHHDIPVVLHLDHATELDAIRCAVDHGFTSVMIDGSCLPFEQNVELTAAAVDIAHPHGVSVEAELGHVGGADLKATTHADSVLTEPEEVTRFVEQTKVDALAVSIGTSHGVYRALPNLNIERLKEIDAACAVPLVLHGGSGTPVDQIQQAVRHGITKLNIYADCRIAMYRGLQEAVGAIKREDPLPQEYFGPIKSHLVAEVNAKIDMLFAADRVAPGTAAGISRG
jgi:fructose-bisphosphate aldolase class II